MQLTSGLAFLSRGCSRQSGARRYCKAELTGVFDHGCLLPGVAQRQVQIAAPARGRILGYPLSLIRVDAFCFLISPF